MGGRRHELGMVESRTPLLRGIYLQVFAWCVRFEEGGTDIHLLKILKSLNNPCVHFTHSHTN